MVGYVTVPCPQNERKGLFHRLDDSIVRDPALSQPHTSAAVEMERPAKPWSRLTHQTSPSGITASKPPEPCLHSPMTISGRITASAASNILSRRRYLLPAFLGALWTRRSQWSPWQVCAAHAFPVTFAPPSLPPSLTLMSVLLMATGWLVAGGAVCGASQVRVLGVLIPSWGCYLFELVFEELTPVRASARTNPVLACCYCCCCRCSVLHPVLGDVLVASLTLVLTACVHAGCPCFRDREGRQLT